MKHDRSKQLFERAVGSLVGGVNSPVRAFKYVGGTPPFIRRAAGAYLWDEDNNKYIDYVGSWGPLILGHAHPKVIRAIKDVAEDGTSFGAPTELEVRLAEMIRAAIPSMELVRFTNSGTEAVMGAIRAARGFAKRDKIIKFDGCYHGHADYLLVKAGSGALTSGTPDSAGVPQDYARHTLVADFNDLNSVERLFEIHSGAHSPPPSPLRGEGRERGGITAVIVEPVAGNMGCVPPQAGFLRGLRELCNEYGALLIFDEVMTGFRVAFGGAQSLFGVRPDLTCLGKIIGGGLPVGAYGGRRDVMECVAPLGPVYQAGTLSGNPVAMAAGIATLLELSIPGAYQRLEDLTKSLVDGLDEVLNKVPHQVTRVGSMWTVFLKELFARYFHSMLGQGIYLPPSPYETAFVSLAHTEEDVMDTIEACNNTVREFNYQ